jgi:hypothetical protein
MVGDAYLHRHRRQTENALWTSDSVNSFKDISMLKTQVKAKLLSFLPKGFTEGQLIDVDGNVNFIDHNIVIRVISSLKNRFQAGYVDIEFGHDRSDGSYEP